MEQPDLAARVVVCRGVCGGMPTAHAIRTPAAIILDTCAEGGSPESVLRESPSPTLDHVRGELAHAAALTRVRTDDTAGDTQ